MTGGEFEQRNLDELLSRYRAALPDPDSASANFMPGVWQKIESRRGISFRLVRWSQALVTAAACTCAAITLLLSAESASLQQSYMEILEDEHDEVMVAEVTRR